jgi:hypothetical protein
MIGGLMKTTSRFALVAAAGLLAGGFALTPAQAADLGGNCCSDLESRVAELEATTARKGNTKVSLTVYGQVNRALMAWDDGKDGDANFVDNTQSSTRFGFKGNAKVAPGWKSGFNIEIEVVDSASASLAQDNWTTDADVKGNNALVVRQANWYLEGDKVGRLTVGQGNTATKDGVLVNLSGSMSDGKLYFNNAFKIRSAAGSADSKWSNFADGLDGTRAHVVRYDTPSIYGFILSAAWGENDFWDTAIRFAKDFGGVKIAAFGGYSYNSASENNLTHAPRDLAERWTGGVSVMHATGLYVNVTGGTEDKKSRKDAAGHHVDANYIYGQAGIHRKFLPVGATTVYGEVAQYNDFGAGTVLFDRVVQSSEVNRWGLGVTQAFDSAALELYAQYHHYNLDATDRASAKARTEDFDAVVTGAKIKF